MPDDRPSDRDPASEAYAASIIVPAYNEADRIGPLLPTLAEIARELHYLVIVACNGCTDRTVEMVREVPGVVVMEIAQAGKPHALNEAERKAGDVFPRLYVDADLRTDARSIQLLVDALRVDEPIAVRPTETYLTDGAPWVCRAVYASRRSVPSSVRWDAEHIEGHHIYGTNRAGRAKFEIFPEEGQMMEDAFFDRMFDPDEKVAVMDAMVYVPLPTSTSAQLRAMTRVYQGNWELTDWLKQHRPDRLFVEQRPPHPKRTLVESVRYYAHGGSSFGSWHPRDVAITLTLAVTREISIRRARRLRRAGLQADWR